MLFSSAEFIFIFLPVTFLVYFYLASRFSFFYAKGWLLLASLFFYAYWHPANVLIIIFSMIFNFFMGKKLGQSKNITFLIIGIATNLGVLFYYKYVDFFLANINILTGSSFSLLHIILPIGISFFTFQQIAFLVDNYEGKVPVFPFADYCLFVTYFPQLIAGPIVHHSEMMPQFSNDSNRNINYENLTRGFFIFNMGLAKKIIIADTMAIVVSRGYTNSDLLTSLEAWFTSICYSIQLYFDFSGYSDMAIGLALLFNIKIPINFNSPYKSQNIQEFWRRWHITLSRFLRDYLYIPLGGSKNGEHKTYRNLFITFLLGGIWHGAGWTFIIWGALHGIALIVNRFFHKLKFNVPVWLSILITFSFVNIAWVFFRANTLNVAVNVLRSMFIGSELTNNFVLITDYYNLPIWVLSVILLFGRNSNEIAESFKPNNIYLLKVVLLVLMNMLFLNSSVSQEFLYFDF
jgi:D-alanyl-lipoteichoic acid acyltransferase DltB (MBOAT superfamily)